MGDAAVAPLPVQEAAQPTLVDVPAPAPERPCLDGAYTVQKGDKPSQDLPLFHYPAGAGVGEGEWLSAEEEAEHVQAAKAGDRQARARLIRAHDPVVASTVLPWKGSLWYEDLLETGRLALLEALEGFDPDRGVRFGVYARTAVRNAVGDAAAVLAHPLEPSQEAMRFRRKAKRARRRFRQEHLREPWYGELVPMLFPEEWPDGEGLDPERVEEANKVIGRAGRLLSEIGPYITELDALYDLEEKSKIAKEGDAKSEAVQGHVIWGGDPASFPDVLEAASATQEDRDRAEARGDMIADLLDAVPLTDRMRFCVRGVLGLDGEGFRTPKELAEELSEGVKHTVRPDSVQRTLKRAARRIRAHLEGGDVDAVDPFAAEEWVPDRDLLDAFAVAREEEPARWAAAVREVLGENPDHPAYSPGRSTPRRVGPPPKAGHHIDLPWTLNK